MARVPLVAERPDDPALAELFERRFREAGQTPIELYRALANSPTMMHAYNGLAYALRHDAETPRAVRELAILRTAQLTRSDYEWAHHRRMGAEAGVTEEQVRELGRWGESEAFDERERAVLRLVDEAHELAVAGDTLTELGRLFSTSEVVELVLLAAFYQAVARVLQALGIEVEPDYRSYLDR